MARRVLIFGGTTEGRILAQRLPAMGYAVSVSVATDLGAEELKTARNITILVGRMSPEEMRRLLEAYDLCIDATHPYAVEATKNVRDACRMANVPLRRVLRRQSSAQGVTQVESALDAAVYLVDKPGNILLTTGAKELSAFSGLDPARIFARVLPTHQGLQACEALGLSHRNILAMQGPFTRRMNEAVLEQYHIAYLVTKDGGKAGGFQEKRLAAEHMGVELILIRRPEDQGVELSALLKELEEQA